MQQQHDCFAVASFFHLLQCCRLNPGKSCCQRQRPDPQRLIALLDVGGGQDFFVEDAEDLCLLAAAADPWSLAVLIPSRRKNFKLAVKTAARLSVLHRDASSVVVSLIRLPLTLSCLARIRHGRDNVLLYCRIHLLNDTSSRRLPTCLLRRLFLLAIHSSQCLFCCRGENH